MSVCEHLSDFIYNEIKYGTKVYKDEWFVHFKEENINLIYLKSSE